jgi:hypothetical protein
VQKLVLFSVVAVGTIIALQTTMELVEAVLDMELAAAVALTEVAEALGISKQQPVYFRLLI